jgi:molecular chaperone GrpE
MSKKKDTLNNEHLEELQDQMADQDASEAQGAPEQVEAEAETPAEESVEDFQDKYLRVLAEFQNYKKRTAKEAVQSTEFANERLMKELLTVIDDMERALAAARENHGEDDPLYTGMQMVHDNLLTVLGRFGLSAINAEGETFDPEKHSAMMQEESDQPAMTVLRQLQRGYELKGRTIRPAAVVVAKAPAGEEQ